MNIKYTLILPGYTFRYSTKLNVLKEQILANNIKE